uniref:FAD-dependent oxidoreductase n=1 Tax=termite gut metagenome TaxID=433724 RepID=S0DDI8_9ZZZZ
MMFYEEPAKKIPVQEFDVVIVGAGTAGVIAAIAAARQGAKTALIESKGYTGGVVVEGGTALHSFFNLWKAFPGVEKRQVVKGIPQELIDRLVERGGCTGHVEMVTFYDYDSICTAIDTEIYKLVTHEMIVEAGVHLFLNTMLTGAIMDGDTIRGVMTESRAGREAFYAKAFVDCTGYGDLSAYAGAAYTEPNDHAVANAIGVGGVDVDRYNEFCKNQSLAQTAIGTRSGEPDKLVRVGFEQGNFPDDIQKEVKRIGMSFITTTLHDDYFMFIKLNYRMPCSPTNRDEVVKTELLLRQRMESAIKIIRKIPGCEKAFMARTSPSLAIRRGRCIECDYDISLSDILDGVHFEDDIMSYGFHDCAPRLTVNHGGTYGIPYKALRVKGVKNLLVAGMLITSDWEAHMSTRNTVSCFGQGQAAGTAAALCAAQSVGTRELAYADLKKALLDADVYLEN